jgi:Amt family ammonium transporter
MVSSALVYLMVAGISLLHSGLSDRRSAISLFRLPLLVSAVVGCQVRFWSYKNLRTTTHSLQWFLFGYSLAFSWRSEREGWTFWGGTSGLVFHDLLIKPVGNGPGARIPEVVYALFQQMFACFT